MEGTVYQINRKCQKVGERGIPKLSVGFESARINFQGLEGDFNVYRHSTRHDDKDYALLIMPLEMILQLNTEGWLVAPGDLGENITTIGMPYDSFAVGKKYLIGDGAAEIQISKPCTPCRNLHVLPYVSDARVPAFIKTLLHRRGWYARVLKEGSIQKGDLISEIS